MPEEVSNIREITQTSDGNVKLSIEKYNELVEKAAVKPPVINRTQVIKTPEMAAQELRAWGGGLMALGATIFTVGALLFRAGLK